MERLFGTDGVRGIPGRPPLTAELVRRLGRAAARLLLARSGRRRNGTAPAVLLGRDTRGSGPALSRALISGFRDAGCRALDLGVAPTPAVSYLTPRLGAVCGAVVSASHNPAEFNGIKFFDPGGFKLAPALEDRIEAEWLRGGGPASSAAAAAAGAPADASARLFLYADFLRSTFPATLDLSGLTVVVDCAHGAAWKLAPGLLEGLGARVARLGCAPDGRNINAGVGALHPEVVAREVVRRRADCGVCFDGDADRALLVDEKGGVLDGDAVIGLAARRLGRQGRLKGGRVAVTVMSNFGLLRFLEGLGLTAVTVPVGDRHVSEAIERGGLSLGGEASGHVIFRDYAVTGDGLLTALQTLAAWREAGGRLSALRRLVRPVPQVLHNLRVARKVPLRDLPRVRRTIAAAESDLEGRGRVFVRYSGTEPLLRVMVEGPSRPLITAIARRIEAAYRLETQKQGETRP